MIPMSNCDIIMLKPLALFKYGSMVPTLRAVRPEEIEKPLPEQMEVL